MADRAIVKDAVEAIRQRVKAWIADKSIDVVISTGGTAKALRDAVLTVTEVADYTGSPATLDGRVKTPHPRAHRAMLARRASPELLPALTTHATPTPALGVAPPSGPAELPNFGQAAANSAVQMSVAFWKPSEITVLTLSWKIACGVARTDLTSLPVTVSLTEPLAIASADALSPLFRSIASLDPASAPRVMFF